MKKYKRINQETRIMIQAYLMKGCKVKEIAKLLGFNKSSIYRELNKNQTIKYGVNIKCHKQNKYPTCNSCPTRAYCNKTKHYYNNEDANEKSLHNLINSRKHSRLTLETIEIIDQIVTYGVKQGQSIYHIYQSNKYVQSLCCEKTIRRLIYRGELTVKAHMLRKYVTYKHSYEKTPQEARLKDVRAYIGRRYVDFQSYCLKYKKANVVQFDSVIGKIHDNKAILTITIPKIGFQFGRLIDKSSPKSVDKQINKLKRKLGNDLFKHIFQANLCDNGVEFSTFYNIETDHETKETLCKSFYTRPYKSSDKPECENLHRLVRYCFPKGKSHNNLTQDMLDEAFSNINSYIRKELNNKCPYDLARRLYGVEFLDKINIHRVQKEKVKLLPLI